jgi:hypothetical protein
MDFPRDALRMSKFSAVLLANGILQVYNAPQGFQFYMPLDEPPGLSALQFPN